MIKSFLIGVISVMAFAAASFCAPEALNQIILNINPHQIAGQPLVTPASILLLDENGLLITDFDLVANPIVLTGSIGILVPDTINNQALFSGGVVNILPAQVRYFGPTGNVSLQASSSSIQSSPTLISFSGYDIEGAVGLSPDTTSSVYANSATVIHVRVINRGDQVASSEPNLRATFLSSGSSNEVSFAPSANGLVEELAIELPTTGLVAGPDTLRLTLQSSYLSSGQPVTVVDTLLIPVMTVAAQGLRFVSSSVRPDSVYAGIPFDLAFTMTLGGVSEPWDSTRYRFELLTPDDSLVAVAIDGVVFPDSFLADSLVFETIAAGIPDSVPPNLYRSRAAFELFRGGMVLRPVAPHTGDLIVLPELSLSYQIGTLSPTEVTSGQEWSFEFDLVLDGSQAMTISSTESFLTLSLANLYVVAPFPATGTVLYPGVNHIVTKRAFIPFEFLGLSLNAEAGAVYFHPGAANHLTFSTDFAGEVINIEALPLIRVIETHVEAPNAPIVNTGQPFQVVCSVANLSSTAMTPFNLQLVTDGTSGFNPYTTITEIPGGDTAEAIFEVVASGSPNPAEIFRVDIATAGVNRLTPIDNIALITIQRPAEISASIIVRGADQGYVNQGDGFDILIGIVNTGEAEATSGRFKINTNGIDLGLPDGATIIEEVVAIGGVRGISFTAPSFDTALQIDIDLIQRPIDVNTGLPAITGDTSFQVALAVTSLDLKLHFEAPRILSHVVLPDGPRDLLIFNVFNPGSSSISNVRLKSLELSLLAADRTPLKVRSVMEVGSTGIYDEGIRVASATAGENHLTLLFKDYVIPASDTVELAFRTRILAHDGAEFTIVLQTSDIEAEIASGPMQGMAVGAITSGDGGVVFDEVFTLVEHSLAGSFAVRDNPWDPGQGPVEFMYYLPVEDDVTFVVLTLTGEEVYRSEFRSGEVGAKSGENYASWDGRSGDGALVVNGVYVVVVSAATARDQATLKLAVLR